MRTYQVQMRAGGRASGDVIEIVAQDVNLATADGPSTAFWNFIIGEATGTITIAAIPFADVESIVS